MSLAKKALEQGEGILRLSPTWVPRSFCVPGRRIKLHPDDYYMLGGARGGIDERWLSSTTPAQNGPLTSKNEGLSHVVLNDGQELKLFLLKDAIDELKGKSSAAAFGISIKAGRCTPSFLTTWDHCRTMYTMMTKSQH